MRNIIAILWTLTLLLFQYNAFANPHTLKIKSSYKISPLTISIDPTHYRWDKITVVNNYPHTLYLKTNLQKTSKNNKAGTKLQQSKIIISPRQIIVPAHSTRFIRVGLVNGNSSHEETYNLTITPVENKLIPKEHQFNDKKIHGNLRILIAYAIHIFTLPRNIKINTVLKKNGHRLTIKNNGNVSVKLSDVQQCANNKKCHLLKTLSKRLHPGKSWEITLPTTDKVKLLQQVGRKSTILKSF